MLSLPLQFLAVQPVVPLAPLLVLLAQPLVLLAPLLVLLALLLVLLVQPLLVRALLLLACRLVHLPRLVLLQLVLLLRLPVARLPPTTKHLLGRKLPLPGSGSFFLPYSRISHAPDPDSFVFVVLALLCHGGPLADWSVWSDEYAGWTGGSGWPVRAWV
ncbi:MAG: hypothetical protein ACRC02_12260 [Vogesella sp.]|uniref:hypothetical protein n=1 Tax=Vogesella sp. TaxID=1904252 RepID=UPI003F3D2470